jgi:hypothetical protein
MHSCTSKFTLLSLVLDKFKMYEDSEIHVIEILRCHIDKEGGRDWGIGSGLGEIRIYMFILIPHSSICGGWNVVYSTFNIICVFMCSFL